MNSSMGPFWNWPSAAQLRYAVWLGCLQAGWFGLLYGGADWFTRQHDYRVALHTSIDLKIPFVPWTVLFYLSMNLLLWLAPFILRTRRELQGIVLAQAAATSIAAPFFLLLPAAAVYPQPDDVALGIFAMADKLARWMALSCNFFPSLHVAFTVICASIYGAEASGIGRGLLWCWGACIVASTLLTHQHYLIDVVGGLVLGRAMVTVVYRRWTAAEDPSTAAVSCPSQTSCPEPLA